jgi:hypothetical protein
MKTILFSIAICLTITINAQHSLEKIWQTDSVLNTPESVLYSTIDKVLYISNINGDPIKKDGNGSVGKLGLDGKIINAEWVKGLDAPKGLAQYKNLLYAADIDKVVVIDTKKSAIVQRIPIEGSIMLNDVTADKQGIIYVSDTRGGKIYKIENGKPAMFLDNIKGVNGLLVHGNELYILADGKLHKSIDGKKPVILAEGMDSSTDGIEMTGENEFIVSCWNGIIYYIKADGAKQVLLDTRNKKINSADIGYNSDEKVVYVPTFYRKSVYAYKLN